MRKKGIFITFEGGEGAGKTTLIEKVKKILSKKHQIVVTREPGGTKFGEHVRQLVLNKKDCDISSKAELCLFLASRSQHIKEVIRPALKQNKIVLCDRYNDSSIAYQGYARGLGIDEVMDFSSFIIEDCIPDLTIYLDLDPKIGLSRVKSGLDRIESEKITFHQKIREGFHILAKKYPDRLHLINANKKPEEVFEDSMQLINKVIDV